MDGLEDSLKQLAKSGRVALAFQVCRDVKPQGMRIGTARGDAPPEFNDHPAARLDELLPSIEGRPANTPSPLHRPAAAPPSEKYADRGRHRMRTNDTQSPWTHLRHTPNLRTWRTQTFIIICRMLGKKIRLLRSAKGYSQEAFADACGLDRTYIGGVERGKRNLGLKNLLRIAQTLGVPPAELLADIPLDSGGE